MADGTSTIPPIGPRASEIQNPRRTSTLIELSASVVGPRTRGEKISLKHRQINLPLCQASIAEHYQNPLDLRLMPLFRNLHNA